MPNNKPKPKRSGRATSVGRSTKGRPAYTLSKKTVKKMGAEGPKRSKRRGEPPNRTRTTPKPARGLSKAMKDTMYGKKPWN